MKRNIYDKSCYAAVTGKMSRLQTIQNIPVTAGETYSIDLVGALRLSQLKRYLTLDCNVHIAAYFVKHRWVYDNWDSFIKNSLAHERGSNVAQSLTTLSTDTLSQSNSIIGYLGAQADGTLTLPKHYLSGYNMIWNHYYRVPNNTDEISETYIWNDAAAPVYADPRAYGLNVARLPAYWNTGVEASNIDATTFSTVDSTGDEFSLLDIAAIQTEYRDQVDREWFAHRYRDIMESRWGSNGINVDVDERPELLIDQTSWLSGVDINGTGDASLGNYKGKSQGIVNLRMPPKYFNEHGMIWIVMALRFPPILEDEVHYDTCHTLTADNFLGYPDVFRTKPPEELQQKDFCGGADTTSWGVHPYGQKFRTLNNHIHRDFHGLEGFPFNAEGDMTNLDDVTYVSDYDPASGDPAARGFFTNDDLGHWNLISKLEIECRSPIPTARESLYAGASL